MNSLFHSVKSLIESAKNQIIRTVNTTMTFTYFEIGRMIVDNEQDGKYRADYSKKVLVQLSEQLTKEFGKGYSPTNLEYIRKFYKVYSNRIPQSVVGKFEKSSRTEIPQSLIEEFKAPFVLSWTHYIQLLKIENNDERNFYEIEAAHGNWSVRELQRQFNSSLFERLALSRDKKSIKELARKGQIIEKPTDALKHHTILEFLDLKEDESYTESDLENAIINKIEHFMLELGKGFLFEGRQKRFSFNGENFFVDLVLYNRLLKCYVLFDLKIGKLNHQDIGQMQMYVNYYDRKIKLPEENSTIGIILCKEENKAVVEFTLPENNRTIFAKEYKLYFPSKEQLRKQLQ
ncbi:MAG: PDDEXK nuclease domain-containing protein [Bacteroidota bacterium]|nr:PDDEXK nuclease domain-containing protein [Bacteroidota bacterium]